ncbi:MAG: hypothetical protein NVSMB56_07050 [Pyrinomonadaceae bacterium]
MISRTNINSFFFALLFTLCVVAAPVFAQEKKITSGDGDYTLVLPSAAWHVMSRGEGVHQTTEIVNGNERGEGFLRIRKEVIEPDLQVSEIAKRDLDQKLPYLPGFVAGTKDNFNGTLSGVVASYEYTNAGKPMLGRIYYLKADARTVYTLHFTGAREKLARIRNQTDSIARSFQSR